MKIPIFKNFRSTNVWKAFALNSIVAMIILVLSITTKTALDKYMDSSGQPIKQTNTWVSVLITMVVTFATTFGAFSLMYILFGFGGGMLVTPSTKN